MVSANPALEALKLLAKLALTSFDVIWSVRSPSVFLQGGKGCIHVHPESVTHPPRLAGSFC